MPDAWPWACEMSRDVRGLDTTPTEHVCRDSKTIRITAHKTSFAFGPFWAVRLCGLFPFIVLRTHMFVTLHAAVWVLRWRSVAAASVASPPARGTARDATHTMSTILCSSTAHNFLNERFGFRVLRRVTAVVMHELLATHRASSCRRPTQLPSALHVAC